MDAATNRRARSGRQKPVAQTPKGSDRWEQIVETSAQIFQEKTFDATSLQDIADAVGIHKGSLYHYIGTKEDLLYAVVDKAHQGTRVANTRWRSLTEEPLEAIRAFVEDHTRASIDLLVYAAVYFRDSGALDPERREAILTARDRYQGQLRDLVIAAAEAGLLRDGIDPSFATLVLFGMMNWIYYWYREDGPMTPDEIVHMLGDYAIASLT
jgi:AcrR family transcriptional regulator